MLKHSRKHTIGLAGEFLWTPLPSPTSSLLTGQWLDFHKLADYHASRTALHCIQQHPIGLLLMTTERYSCVNGSDEERGNDTNLPA